MALKAAGLIGINTSHPRLLALLDAGVTDTELTMAATEAVARNKGFAYVLGMVEGRRRDAAAAGAVPGPSVSPREAEAIAAIQALTPSLAAGMTSRKP